MRTPIWCGDEADGAGESCLLRIAPASLVVDASALTHGEEYDHRVTEWNENRSKIAIMTRSLSWRGCVGAVVEAGLRSTGAGKGHGK